MDTSPVSAPVAGRGILVRRRVVLSFLVGTACSLGLVILTVRSAELPPPGAPPGYVSTFSPPRSGFEVLLNHGDGQAYAQIARDPLLEHPEAFTAPSREVQAFWAQRPLLSYSGWALSLGRSDLLEVAFVVLTALSGGLLVAAVAALVELRGEHERDRFAVAVLAVPIVLVSLTAFGPDVMGPALALAGLACWTLSTPRRGLAALAFVLAALARESTMMVPFVLGLYELRARRLRASDMVLLASPVAGYLGWMLVVRLRTQVGPVQTASDSSVAAPFVGLWGAHSGWEAADVVMVALMLGALTAIGIRHRRAVEGGVMLAMVLASTMLSKNVWKDWMNAGRVMVVAAALAVVVLLAPGPRSVNTSTRTAVES